MSPMRVALYARISTHDQHTLAMQMDAMHEFTTRRGWTVIDTVEEIASGAKDNRPKRQALLKAAKQRKLAARTRWSTGEAQGLAAQGLREDIPPSHGGRSRELRESRPCG